MASWIQLVKDYNGPPPDNFVPRCNKHGRITRLQIRSDRIEGSMLIYVCRIHDPDICNKTVYADELQT